jgi:polysaccharide pyruvyl transferase WcaK-like protein
LSARPPRIGVIGTYGNGNLGDEAIFVAFLQWLQQHAPNVVPVSLSVNPAYIAQQYGIPAYAVSAHHAEARADNPTATGAPQSSVSTHGHAPAERTNLRRWLRDLLDRFSPVLARALRSCRQFVVDAWAVARFFPAQLRVARSLHSAIVLGGGQIHDFWTGPLGHPATLFCWALACRLAGRPFVIASVGAVDLRHHLSRWFVRNAFRCSRLATVRDEASAAVLRSTGLRRRCGVLPDLAWGLNPAQPIGHAIPDESLHDCDPSVQPRTIGVCPMAYRHPQHWPAGDIRLYSEYIGALASFCCRLIREGYEVVLFPTQISSDGVAMQDLAAQIGPELRDHVRLWRVNSVPDLLICLGSVDAVVTSRFHGLLLSLLAGRPALSLSYQQKNDALLGELGERRFALDVHHFSADTLWASFEQLRKGFGAYSARIGPHLDCNRQLLDSQYREIFAVLGWPPPPVPTAVTGSPGRAQRREPFRTVRRESG